MTTVDHDALERALAAPSMRGASAEKIALHVQATYGVDAAAHPSAWMVRRKRELAVELVVGGPSLGPSTLDLGALWFEGATDAVKRLTKVRKKPGFSMGFRWGFCPHEH